MEFFDDGPTKPTRIWSRIGRRPILAGGNSNGDIPMLRFAGGGRDRRSGCCSCTTTRSASSTTRRARRMPLNGPPRGLDRDQRQGRLDQGLRGLTPVT